MNVGDTEIVVSVMQCEGYIYTDRIDEADIILINTVRFATMPSSASGAG